ncbi:MAG: macro domain-containing protein [Planctomycetales bacterium]
MAIPIVVAGDLLDQDVAVIVNSWNRNIIPWWLLVPQGVSGAIKRRGGYRPFRELAKHGSIPLGGAVLTSAGKLPFQGIIHVAAISMWWISSESLSPWLRSQRHADCHGQKFPSVAFPAWWGREREGHRPSVFCSGCLTRLKSIEFPGEIRIVRYAPSK